MNGPRFNEWIQSPKVRVIDHEGENLGVMYTREAMAQAQEVGLDLVEVSPNADPPVAKFLDVGKFKYEAQKKANLARKSQKTQEIKEIKMRPNIDDHDYDTKMKKVAEFIEDGDKVKVTMRFRGRELSHGQLGMNVLQRVAERLDRAVAALDHLGRAGVVQQCVQHVLEPEELVPAHLRLAGRNLDGDLEFDAQHQALLIRLAPWSASAVHHVREQSRSPARPSNRRRRGCRGPPRLGLCGARSA